MNNIETISDLFDVTFPPDKEIYDRYHDVEDDLELQQWWFKPVMIVYPKNSVAVRLRQDFSALVTDLRTRIPQEIDLCEFDRQAKLLELQSIVNFLKRKQLVVDEDDESESNINGSVDLKNLLSICDSLKAVEAKLVIWNVYSSPFFV